MHPRNLLINDFDYHLPGEKIAAFPLAERDHSRLLIYNNAVIAEDKYYNIASHLPENAMLVFNNTRVIEARINFRKPTGGVIEIFALEPHEQYNGIGHAMQATGKVWWKCLIGGAGKWKHGQVLEKQFTVNDTTISLHARIVERETGSFTIEFTWQPQSLSFSEILGHFGAIPIPPYLKREQEAADHERYQTVYALTKGSVAAPTAGLHFTERIFQSLKAKNIAAEYITLHVGAGTFMPVKTESIGSHNMHAESFQVAKSFLEKLATMQHAVIAVGTTSLRTLESIYWMGVKCVADPFIKIENMEILQWQVYEELPDKTVPVKTALEALILWMNKEEMDHLTVKTSILIAPPYQVRMVRGLITNFHQPKSTLLLLIAALIGEDWHKVYGYALENNFRFLSYGDGCLLYV